MGALTNRFILAAQLVLYLGVSSMTVAQQPSGDVASAYELTRQVVQLRTRIMSHPTDINSLLDLAMACQQLNYLKPDGGTRVQEGVAAYR